MEHAELAAAIWVLRSRTQSDLAESPDGSPGGSGVRGGICFVSRDAAREASHSPLRLHHGLSFAGISRRRETLCGIRTRPAHPGPPRALMRESGALRGFTAFYLFQLPCRACRFSCALCRRLRHAEIDPDSAGRI